ncbi:hypothetical protein INR49_010936 [Caranx melampygus]|nr:hypothetical protein INR49_010936 [Caranx melampygus]
MVVRSSLDVAVEGFAAIDFSSQSSYQQSTRFVLLVVQLDEQVVDDGSDDPSHHGPGHRIHHQ